MNALLKELEEHAAAAVRADRVAERHKEAIRELLPKARAAGAGAAELERTIQSIYVAGTISRWTKDVVPDDKPRPGRKRKPPSRPAGSS